MKYRGANPADVPEMLKRARAHANLTQMQLAAKVGTTERYIGHLETGERTPSMKLYHKILDACGFTPTMEER